MAKYQQYAEYKDSGVEWLGKVPEHWIISSIKYLTKSVGTGGTPKNLISFTDDEEINWFTPADFLGDLEVQISSKYVTFDSVKTGDSKLYQSGSVLMIGIGATLGKIAICNKSFSCNQQINVLVPNRAINSEYLAYALIVQIEQIKQLSNSSTIGIINQDKTKQILITLSSLDEQIQIANFLDHETAKIDSLIEKQQQLIELLKEKRQAVISHAVTKGLNPNVPMKDSGVEWLGDVPEHWTVTRAKLVSDIFVPQRNKPELNEEEGCAWVTMDDMKNKYIQSVNRYVAKNSVMLAGSKILQKGAVIASCVGNFGVTSINNIDVIINQQLQAFIPRNIKAEYLQNLVSISKNYFELIGTAATLVYVNQEGFQNLPVLLPPHDEQVAICVQIENDENKYDQLIQLGLKQIKILQERRTALISAAVTGKVDVRNWQNPNNNNEAKMEFSA